MHLLMFYGFLSLFLATTLLAINSYGPVKFHRGSYYLGYEFVFDVLGLMFVIGCAWALISRFLKTRRDRNPQHNCWVRLCGGCFALGHRLVRILA